jgi:hypothetical protein
MKFNGHQTEKKKKKKKKSNKHLLHNAAAAEERQCRAALAVSALSKSRTNRRVAPCEDPSESTTVCQPTWGLTQVTRKAA